MRGLLLMAGICVALIWGSCSPGSKIDSYEGAGVRTLIEGRNFVFLAQNAQPSRGVSRQLTSEYMLRLSGDTLTAFLPYFGRAYQAPPDMRGGGIQFTTSDYSYGVEEKRKGRWNIAIDPKGKGDVRSMNLSVSQNGYASLQVLSNNREPITFSGIVAEKERLK